MEKILLVDLDDNPLGFAPKLEVHEKGLLHRAFSVFVIQDGKMLIQRRSPEKYHSGGLWANTCCSHQREGETLEEAVHRRLEEELGFDCPLKELFHFVYRTRFENALIEYEMDHVFLGRYSGEIMPNADEVCETEWIDLNLLKDRMLHMPEQFASWFLIAAPSVLEETRKAYE